MSIDPRPIDQLVDFSDQITAPERTEPAPPPPPKSLRERLDGLPGRIAGLGLAALVVAVVAVSLYFAAPLGAWVAAQLVSAGSSGAPATSTSAAASATPNASASAGPSPSGTPQSTQTAVVVVPSSPTPTPPPACDHEPHWLTGWVTFTDGAPAVSTRVRLYNASDGRFLLERRTDSEGVYVFPVQGDTRYKLSFTSSSGRREWYRDKSSQTSANVVLVCATDVGDVDADISR